MSHIINENYRTLPMSAILKILTRKFEYFIFPFSMFCIFALVIGGCATCIAYWWAGQLLQGFLYLLAGVSTGIVAGMLMNALDNWQRDFTDVDEIAKNWGNYYLD